MKIRRVTLENLNSLRGEQTVDFTACDRLTDAAAASLAACPALQSVDFA